MRGGKEEGEREWKGDVSEAVSLRAYFSVFRVVNMGPTSPDYTPDLSPYFECKQA
jgi:hypothetical protein